MTMPHNEFRQKVRRYFEVRDRANMLMNKVSEARGKNRDRLNAERRAARAEELDLEVELMTEVGLYTEEA